MRQKPITLSSVRAAGVALALLCLSVCSCSNDESQPAAGSGISAPLAFRIVTADYQNNGTTRGTPSEDLYESMGLYAHVYDDEMAWDNGAGTAPNYMVNEEVQNAGTYWLTVNAFDIDNMTESGRYMRFFAYYPYGLDASILEVSNEERDNAPLLVYTVPENVEDQKDLLAGSSFDDDGHIKVYETEKQATIQDQVSTAEDVTLKLSHLLTAVKFQIGECVEAGRIKQITVTNVLGKNQYSLQRDADDNYFEGWDNTRAWGGSYDDDYRDFSIDLSKQIKVTQKNANNEVVPQAVTDDTQWLMMIPQRLSEETELHVIYNSGGSDHELVADLEDFEWLQGKRVVYTLNINSLQRLTVKSTVLPWGEGLIFVDGQPSNATDITMEDKLEDWTTREKDVYSDDTEESEWRDQ